MAIPSLRRDLRHLIEMVLQEQPQPVPTSRSPLGEKKLMRCSFCHRNADRKVQTYCGRCLRVICNEHKLILYTTFVPLWNKYRSECYKRFCTLNNESKFNSSILLLINHFPHLSVSYHSLHFICSNNCFFFFQLTQK